MSDLPKNVMTVESAIDAAISAYESGDLKTAPGSFRTFSGTSRPTGRHC